MRLDKFAQASSDPSSPVIGRRMGAALAKATTLIEALPWLERFAGAIVVVKFGGNAMIDDDLKRAFAADMVFLQRCAKDIQAFPGNPTADVKNDTVFQRKSVDSARHGRAACCPLPHWQTERQPQLTENAAKAQTQSPATR